MNKKEEIIEDFLEVDPPIPGQNYCCLSFVSPEHTLKRKDYFTTMKFLQDLFNDENKKTELLNTKEFTYEKVDDLYKDFLVTNEIKIQKEFDDLVDFQTNIRGIKVRGVYESLREAQLRAKLLKKRDPNFHIWVGQVSHWLPFDPTRTDNVEEYYEEGQLNEMMKKYKENVESRDEMYEQHKRDQIDKARKENEERKKKHMEEKKLNDEAEAKKRAEERAEKEKSKEKKPRAPDEEDDDNNEEPPEKDTSPKIGHALDTEEQAAQKISELRKILDEKDRKFYELEKQNKSNMATVNENPFSEKQSRSIDPWMQRKLENIEKEAVETVKTEEKVDEIQTQDSNLQNIIKNIF